MPCKPRSRMPDEKGKSFEHTYARQTAKSDAREKGRELRDALSGAFRNRSRADREPLRPAGGRGQGPTEMLVGWRPRHSS